LWTDFSLQGNPRIAAFEARQVLNDFAKIRVSPSFRRFRPFDSVGLFRGSLRWLKAELTMANGADVVVVTHHAPSKLSVPQCFHDDLLSAAFASHLDEFIESSAIDLWIHGHIHESRDYEIGDTRIVCNPRGYPDAINADFDPGMVVST
jgi:hypothetical protein